jgi:hypothetical protein
MFCEWELICEYFEKIYKKWDFGDDKEWNTRNWIPQYKWIQCSSFKNK